MERTTLTIDGTSYRLRQNVDVAAVKADLEQAAHVGGAFISVDTDDEHSISVHITATVAAVLNTQHTPDDNGTEYEPARLFDEVDYLDLTNATTWQQTARPDPPS